MTLAYACVLIAAFLPYVWTVIAKRSAGGRFDNRDPERSRRSRRQLSQQR